MYSSNPNDYQKPAPMSNQARYHQSATGIPMSSYGQAPTQFQSNGPVWSTGLCACFDDPASCCTTCCCPCITFGRIAEVVDKGSTSCIASGGLYFVLAFFTGFGCMYSCCYRSKMRHQYMLPENPCGDCLVHCCCEACALCQEYRELQHHGFNMSLGWEDNMARQNQGVVMPPMVPGGMSK